MYLYKQVAQERENLQYKGTLKNPTVKKKAKLLLEFLGIVLQKTITDKNISNCKLPREPGDKETGDVLYNCWVFFNMKTNNKRITFLNYSEMLYFSI